MSLAADFRHVVRHRDFRRLFAVRLTAQCADGFFQVALASYVFFSPERQTTAAEAAAAFAVLLLPYSIVGPFAGVLLDRWQRRQILVVANVVRAALVVVVTVEVLADLVGPVFYVTALAVLSVNRFFLAALSAALPHVVEEDELVMANSVSTTSGTLAALAGAGGGFLVREAAGQGDQATAVALTGAVAIYLASALLALRLARDLLGPDFDPALPQVRSALRNVVRGLADGARHVIAHRPAAYALGAIAGHRFFFGIATIATILLYRNYFFAPGQNEQALAGLAGVFVVSGAGVLAAAVLTPEVTYRVSLERWIVTCYLGAAVVQVVFGAPYEQIPLLLAAFLLGLVSQSSKICVDTIIQEWVDDAYRGRVFSFYDVVFNVAFVSAAAFAALALPSTGKSYAVLGVIAGGYALTGLLYGRATARAGLRTPGDSTEVTYRRRRRT